MARRILNGTSLADRIIATTLPPGDWARSLLGDGNDIFEGSAGGDQAFGEAGNDALFGFAGKDSLVGGDGNDTLDGGDGKDTLDGGDGNDSLLGGDGEDVLRGGAGNNRIAAGAGNDRVTAGDDGDMIWGDGGNDTINAGGGNNWVYGGSGRDSITAGDAGDMLWGEDGHDVIRAGGGNNWVYGGQGEDRIIAGDGSDMLWGDHGNDTIQAGGGNNWAYGGQGNDSIIAGAGHDMIFGEDGHDIILDAGGNNAISGGQGHDRITLGDGNDQVTGDQGNDTIHAGDGQNLVSGGDGRDQLTSGSGSDQLDGGAGHDILRGGGGQDLVLGGLGNDFVLQGVQEGAPGQDMLRGGAGFDTLRLLFTNAEWLDAANQAELARLVAANATPAAKSGAVISSTLFGMNFAEFEALSVAVDGTVLNLADDPVRARNDTVNLLEGGSVSFSVVANDTVPDLIASVALVGLGPSPGIFSLNNAGLMSFNTGTAFEHLAAGQVATLRFTYRVTDADGDADEARVALRITGTNDAASISGTSTGAVAEDGTLTTGGTLTVADVDAGDARFMVPTSLAGSYGNFTFNANSGVWGYTLNNALAQSLDQGEVAQDVLTVTSRDGTASRAITVSIAGANDAPMNLMDVNGAPNIVLEDVPPGSATGITMAATDADGEPLTYSFKVGGFASDRDASGAFAIDAATGVIRVANGSVLNFEAGATQTLTVFAQDAQGAETSANVVIEIADRDETPNHAIILSFDDVPGGLLGDGAEQPLTTYGGFTWTQAGIYNPDGALGYTTSSGSTLAFFAEARGFEVPGYPAPAGSPLSVERTDGQDFIFYSANFSAAFGTSVAITVRAYDDAVLVGEVTITAPFGDAPNFDFGLQYPGQRFTSIDRLEFSAPDYFGLDDFAYFPSGPIIGP
jgi:VCBS repeat-containing protein